MRLHDGMRKLVALALLVASINGQHHCGPMKRHAMMPHHIGYKLAATLRADAKDHEPDGCNNCPHAGWSAVWAAPGDICDLQMNGPGSIVHFKNCDREYAKDYKLEDHVKLCLKKEEIDWLWTHDKDGEETEHGHCQTSDGMPHLGPEGLLVCNKLNGCTIL